MSLTMREQLLCKTILQVAESCEYGHDAFITLPCEVIDMLHNYLTQYCDDDNLRYAESYITDLFLGGCHEST